MSKYVFASKDGSGDIVGVSFSTPEEAVKWARENKVSKYLFDLEEVEDGSQPLPDFASVPGNNPVTVDIIKAMLPKSMAKEQSGEGADRYSIASDLITGPLRIGTGLAISPFVGAAGAISAPWGDKTKTFFQGVNEGFQQGADQNPDAGFVESAWKDPMTSMFMGAGPALGMAGEGGGQLLSKLPSAVGKGVDYVKNIVAGKNAIRSSEAMRNFNTVTKGKSLIDPLTTTGNILGVGTAGTGVALTSRALTDENGISSDELAIDAALNYGTAGLASILSKLGEKVVTTYLIKRYGSEPDKLAVLLGEVDKMAGTEGERAYALQKDVPDQILAPTKAGTMKNAAQVAQDPIHTNKLVKDIYQSSGKMGNPEPVVNETPLNPSSWYAGKTIEEPAKVVGLIPEVPWVQQAPTAKIRESLMSPDWQTPLIREVEDLNFRFTNGEILELEYKKAVESIRSISNQLRDMSDSDASVSIRPYMTMVNKLSESNPELADVLLRRVIKSAQSAGIDVNPYLNKLDTRNELIRLSQLKNPNDPISLTRAAANVATPFADIGSYLANPMARGGEPGWFATGRGEKLTPYIMGASDQLMGLDTLKSSK